MDLDIHVFMTDIMRRVTISCEGFYTMIVVAGSVWPLEGHLL